MVKVVQQGSLTKHVTCKRCKSELEYEPEDVESISYEDSPTIYHIQCPFCLQKLGQHACFVYVRRPSEET